MSAADAIRLHPADTVAVALRDVAPGARLRWQGGGESGEVAAREAVPLGHKIALRSVSRGAMVVKYGAPIGAASADIGAGDHVHVHNLVSARVKGKS